MLTAAAVTPLYRWVSALDNRPRPHDLSVLFSWDVSPKPDRTVAVLVRRGNRVDSLPGLMAVRKIAITLYIGQKQHDALKVLSRHTKVPMAVYLRDAADLVLQQHGAELAAAQLAEQPAEGQP